METMNVEQAVFASSDRGSMKGYQLVSKSSGLDRASSAELSRWSPTRLSGDNLNHWILNCFPICNNSVAITRTVFGGPEYSGRGGTEVVTMLLVLHDEQFAAYGFNPVAVARTAMATGYLRLPLDMTQTLLTPVELPRRPITVRRDCGENVDEQVIEKVAKLLDDSHRVAVGGVDQPLDFVDCLVSKMPAESRRHLSFTTGLRPSVNRPFQVHLYSSMESRDKQFLASQDILLINAN